jgi:hypothetical protein
MTLGFFVGLWPLAHFIWPPAPTETAEQIAQFFQTDPVLKRTGLFIAMLSTGLLAPFYAVISVQMKRIEGGTTLPLTYTQLVAGACTVLEIILPLMLWQGVAYRPDRNIELTQTLNDIAWLIFLGTTTTVLIQNLVIGMVTLQDRNPNPVFPRWYAYFNFFAVAGVMPAGFVVFFKNGPLAWNGIIVWAIGVAVFFVWICATAWLVQVAAGRQHEEQAATAAEVTVTA